MRRTISPLRYLGSKARTAHRIVALLPAHGHYVEPYAGGLAVLFAKPATTAETVSDADGRLVHFWRVLRDRPEELARVCALNPHSHSEYYASWDDDPTLPDVERARRTYTLLVQGVSRTTRPTRMWAKQVTHNRPGTSPAHTTAQAADRLLAVAERLRAVAIENRQGLDAINKYDHPNALFYLDPPYLPSERTNQSAYTHEMTQDDHQELLERIQHCRAAVAISGYPSPLYDEALKHWHRHDFPVLVGGRSGHPTRRTESLWIKEASC